MEIYFSKVFKNSKSIKENLKLITVGTYKYILNAFSKKFYK